MRTPARCLGIVLLATATCGGSSGRTDSGVDASTVSPRTDGSTVIPTAACDSLACVGPMDDLWATCLVDGTCTKQTTSSATTSCFGNGVKVQTTTGATGTTVTAKKGDAICYTKAFASASASGGTPASSTTVTVQNGSGATVATLSIDGSILSVTCPGGTPTQVDDSCVNDFASFYYSHSTTPPTCTEGACTF